MAHVSALAQHILTLEPDKDAARLCFYHYLIHLCEPGEAIHADLLNRFFCRALTFSHWQENKVALFREIASIIGHYEQTHADQLVASASTSALVGSFQPEDLQVVPVETLDTLELVINRYLERTASPYDQIRTLREGGDRVVAITLQADRGLRITVYPKVLAIREGELVPLTQDYSLFYTSELQLNPMMIQQIEIGPHTAARFHAGLEGIRGIITRGYTFQKYSAMDGGGVNRYPVLFYPLKRLEQFFVNRKSDPMYIELTGVLEKALDLTNGGHPEAFKFAEAALSRGRLALEHIFPDDKLVRLLINNLEKTLALETARQGYAQERASAKTSGDELGIDLLENQNER